MANPREGFVNVNGLKLTYEDHGSVNHEPILLIMGLGAQMTLWPDELVHDLVGKEYRVIRFDNRDIGLSSKVKQPARYNLPLMMVQSRLGLPRKGPYTLYDMADDTHGLMENLSIEKAHIVGASMGGMIAQIFAARYPEKTRTLTSIMSNTNSSRCPTPSLSLMYRLAGGGGPRSNREEDIVKSSLQMWKAIGSPAFPTPESELEQRITREYRRSYRPSGMARQTAAIMATGSFEHELKKIRSPSLIIHGSDDRLVPLGGGKRSHKKIRNSKMEIIKGMGHDLPDQLVPRISELIHNHASGKH